MTLRELLWQFEGVTYQQLMIECSGIAGAWNAHRTRKADRVWLFSDFHPHHLSRPQRKTSHEIMQSIAAQSGDIEWAEGYGIESL